MIPHNGRLDIAGLFVRCRHRGRATGSHLKRQLWTGIANAVNTISGPWVFDVMRAAVLKSSRGNPPSTENFISLRICENIQACASSSHWGQGIRSALLTR